MGNIRNEAAEHDQIHITRWKCHQTQDIWNMLFVLFGLRSHANDQAINEMQSFGPESTTDTDLLPSDHHSNYEASPAMGMSNE